MAVEDGQFKPGNPGKPKGSPNKIPAQIREWIFEALKKAHPDGAIAYLAECATEDRRAFCALVGKAMGSQAKVEFDGGSALRVTIEPFPQPGDNGGDGDGDGNGDDE